MKLIRILKKYKLILNKRQQWKVVLLFIMMIIGGMLEMLSVSLVFPFMETAMKIDEFMKNEYVMFICDFLGIRTGKGFLVLIAVFLAVLYMVKNLYLIFQTRVQSRFVYNCMLATQRKLLKSYLERPYEYFLKVNTGEILRIVGKDTADTFDTLQILLSLLSELIVSAFLIVTIFVMAPFLTVAIAVVLLLATFVILKIIRPRLSNAGKNSQDSLARMNGWLLQSIQGIKEIKVGRCENFFEENFEESGAVYVKSLYHNKTLTIIPRYMLEALSMSSIFVVIVIMILGGVSIEPLIPILSGVSVAAVRLLPSVNRIISSLGTTAFYGPMIDKTIENVNAVSLEIDSHDEKNETSINFEKSIEGKGVSYSYPNSEEMIFDNADFFINKGDSVGIIGESGAGKTTLVDIMLGLLHLNKGMILVDNKSINDNVESWLENIGYVPQQIFMLDSDIRHNVAFGVSDDKINDDQIWEVLREASLFDFVSELPDGLDTELGERGIRLSGGQRQRIGIARALYFNPDIIVFDEATSALDNQNEMLIMESINNLHGKKTTIIIAHRLSTIEKCDRVLCVRNGKIEVQK